MAKGISRNNASARPGGGDRPSRRVVLDRRSGKLAELMGYNGLYYQLRPIGGGVERDVPPEYVRFDLGSDDESESCQHQRTVRVNGKKYCDDKCGRQLYL